MSSGNQAHRQKNRTGARDAILAAARRLFTEHGYSGTSTSTIARQVGISAPALYWHFASKEAILFAIIEASFADFHRSLRFEAEDSKVRLAELVSRYVTFQLEQPRDNAVFSSHPALNILGNVLTGEHRDKLRVMQRSVYEIFKDCLKAGTDAGDFHIADATVTAFALISLCEYVHTWAQHGGRRTPEEIAGEYVVLAMRMVGIQED